MCRILAVTSFEWDRHEDLVRGMIGLGETGRVLAEDPPGHEDGWGLGWYEGGAARLHRSGGSVLAEREAVLGLVRGIGSSSVLVFHLRKSAWPGTSVLEHAHPFLYENTLFAHNGTVRDYETLFPEVTVPGDRPLGLMKDTEVFLLHVLSRKTGGLRAAFETSLARVRAGNRFSSLNSVLTDGKTLLACRDYTAHPEYYSLYVARDGGSAVVSSEPLGDRLAWRSLEKGELLALG